MSFYKTILSNGLTIIGECRKEAPCVAFGFFVNTGSRDESPEIAGVSHFLEHMMFKGTEKRTSLEITFELASIGAQANACTSVDSTIYYAAVLPEYLDKAINIYADMLRPVLDQKEFDMEKNVILEEIALYQDRPTYVIFEKTLEMFFQNHSAGNSVLGTTDTIGKLSRDQMFSYYSSRYTPSNTVLAISGAFDWNHLEDMVNNLCGFWEKKEVSKRCDKLEKKPANQITETIISKQGLQQAYVCLASEGPSANQEFRFASKVLCCILGDVTGSKVYWELIDKGLCDSVTISPEKMEDVGVICAFASTELNKLDQVTDILSKIMDNAGDFSDKELERAKTKLCARVVLGSESSAGRVMSVGAGWLHTGNYQSPEETIQKIKSIQRHDIEKCLKKFCFKPDTIVKMINPQSQK